MPPRKTVQIKGEKLNIFGPKFRAIRLAKGLTLKAMAAKIQTRGWDLTETSLGHIEAGRRAITDSELMMLLQVLGARLSDLEC